MVCCYLYACACVRACAAVTSKVKCPISTNRTLISGSSSGTQPVCLLFQLMRNLKQPCIQGNMPERNEFSLVIWYIDDPPPPHLLQKSASMQCKEALLYDCLRLLSWLGCAAVNTHTTCMHVLNSGGYHGCNRACTCIWTSGSLLQYSQPLHAFSDANSEHRCVCVCARARACVCVCVCVEWCNPSTSCYGFCCSIAIIGPAMGVQWSNGVCVCVCLCAAKHRQMMQRRKFYYYGSVLANFMWV